MKQNRSSADHNDTQNSSKSEAGKRQVAVDENLKKFDSTVSATVSAEEVKLDDATQESGLDKFTNQLLKLAPGIADSSITQAKETIEQAISTFEQAKETYAQAKETIAHVKSTIEEVKSSAKGAIGKIRANPQPFFAAIAPGAIGAFLLVEKWRKSQMAQR
ncbi:hypothetical protein BH10BDE1_BH10BDE1_33750 [soil metagenome]